MSDVAKSASKVMAVIPGAKCTAQANALKKITFLADKLDEETQKLAKIHNEAVEISNIPKQARFYADKVIPQMEATRAIADSIEPILGEKYKPYPSYSDLLFRV
jgi:glutamine synthetase